MNRLLQATYFSYLSRPAAERPVYRAICRIRPAAILELGIGDGQRALRMLRLASLYRPPGEIRYTGLDRFEDRTSQDGPGMTLKLAYRMLGRSGATIRLLPGEPLESLGARANDLGQFDVVVISRRLDYRRAGWAWYFLPRLLNERTVIFRENALPGGRLVVEPVGQAEIRALAQASSRSRAA